MAPHGKASGSSSVAAVWVACFGLRVAAVFMIPGLGRGGGVLLIWHLFMLTLVSTISQQQAEGGCCKLQLVPSSTKVQHFLCCHMCKVYKSWLPGKQGKSLRVLVSAVKQQVAGCKHLTRCELLLCNLGPAWPATLSSLSGMPPHACHRGCSTVVQHRLPAREQQLGNMRAVQGAAG